MFPGHVKCWIYKGEEVRWSKNSKENKVDNFCNCSCSIVWLIQL